MNDREGQIAEYVLGTLPLEQRLGIEKALQSDASLRLELEVWEQSLSPLNDAYQEKTPPLGILEAVERRLHGEYEAAPQNTLWDRLGFWRGFAIASSFAFLTLVGVIFYQSEIVPRGFEPQYFAALENDKAQLQIMAFYQVENRALKIIQLAGKPKDGRDFELWFIGDNEAPISLGVLPHGQRVELRLDRELADKFNQATTLAISDEPDGGSPTGKVTGAVLAASQVNKI